MSFAIRCLYRSAYLLLSLVAVLSLMMSNQSEAPKESSCQDWSASAASTLAADQSEHSTSRAGDSQEQSSGGVQSLAVVPNPSPAPASTPVALATASLPQQPMSHLQLVSQMVSGATTQSAQVRQWKISMGFISCCITFECILDIKCYCLFCVILWLQRSHESTELFTELNAVKVPDEFLEVAFCGYIVLPS